MSLGSPQSYNNVLYPERKAAADAAWRAAALSKRSSEEEMSSSGQRS